QWSAAKADEGRASMITTTAARTSNLVATLCSGGVQLRTPSNSIKLPTSIGNERLPCRSSGHQPQGRGDVSQNAPPRPSLEGQFACTENADAAGSDQRNAFSGRLSPR